MASRGDDGGGYASTVNIDPFFAVPVDAGMIRLTDLRRFGADGEPLVTLDEVFEANEILTVRYENQRRAHERSRRSANSGIKR